MRGGNQGSGRGVREVQIRTVKPAHSTVVTLNKDHHHEDEDVLLIHGYKRLHPHLAEVSVSRLFAACPYLLCHVNGHLCTNLNLCNFTGCDSSGK